MKASVAWVNSYLPAGAALDATRMDELLTFAGLPIDATEPLGTGDARLEVEVTSNRGDCLCQVGLARELAAVQGVALHAPDSPALDTPSGAGVAGLSLRNTVHDACPMFTATLIRGVKVGPSPAWLAQRLEAIGQRPINNVVDVTNFVLHELGQPSHVFDLATLRGGALCVRRANKGEALALLDGRTVTLGGGEVVIADGAQGEASRAVSLAGVMGGSLTGVTERTTDVVLEVATWDPVAVRTASRRHNARSDSSHRYERVVDQRTMEPARARLVQLLLQVAGGRVEGALADGRAHEALAQVDLREARIGQVLGLHIDGARVEGVLGALGFGVRAQPAGGGWRVTVPAHRPDVRLEIDLIEEVARIVGYDKLVVPEKLAVRVTGAQRTERASNELARVLTGLGCYEAVTFSFTDAKQAALLVPAGLELVRVSDDRRGSENVCRPSVLAGLLACRRANHDARSAPEGSVRLYEVASAFAQRAGGANGAAQSAHSVVSVESRRLALVIDAPAEGGAFERRQLAVRLVRGAVERAGEALAGAGALTFEPATGPLPAGWDEQATARVLLGGQPIGLAGMAGAPALAHYDLPFPVAMAEIEIAGLLERYPPRADVRALPTMPASPRDLSVIVPEGVAWQHIERVVADVAPAAAGACFEGHEFVGTYRGKPLEPGSKSVTLRMTFRAPDRTLRDAEINPWVEAVVARLKGELGATLRA
jgi:phenylalanyl-tRNA synthetase beta chain